MKKCIFIVPTHILHFEHAYKLRDSFSRMDFNADLMFILSNEEESRRFEEGGAKKSHIINGFPRGSDHRGIITVKKLQGIEHAMRSGYEYAIVLDCETTFTRSFNAYEVAKYLSEKKVVYSTINNHNVLNDINTRCADFFNDEEKQKLRELTKDFTEYFWFNDLAFYDLKICQRFFEKVYNGDGLNFYSKISSAHFDHTIYIYYCLLYENYKLINLNEKLNIPVEPYNRFHLGILEAIGDRTTRDIIPIDIAKALVKEMDPFWMPYGTDLRSEKCFMLFHYDRC